MFDNLKYLFVLAVLAIVAHLSYKGIKSFDQRKDVRQAVIDSTINSALAYFRQPKDAVRIYDAQTHINIVASLDKDAKELKSMVSGLNKLKESEPHILIEQHRVDSLRDVHQNLLSQKRKRESNRLSAEEENYTKRTWAKDYVKKHLKSPSTAKFSDISTSIKDGVITVTGYVDSQNGFGAMLRSEFVILTNKKGKVYSFKIE